MSVSPDRPRAAVKPRCAASRERRPANQTAGLILLVRDAVGQSGLTQSPPQTHKRTHPSPEQAVAHSKPGDG